MVIRDRSGSVVQFTPQLTMMRTRARGEGCLQKSDREAALVAIESGIAELSEFYREHEREELIDQSGEIQSLRAWLDEIRTKPPQNEIERLRFALAEAIRIEDYEKAAEVRDQLRKLQASET